jgi:hypothetical protein
MDSFIDFLVNKLDFKDGRLMQFDRVVKCS